MSNLNAVPAGRWFKRVLWLGILANLALAVPTLFAPAQLLTFSNLPQATPILWPQFAALLLILLSIFYMPAGVDLARYKAVAWLAVGARLAGVIFFVGFQAAAYHLLGYFDLAFFIPESILLVLAIRGSMSMTPEPRGAWS
ncbi:MAG TPA: hypothetical protein VH583_19075 [Vicinamibacterales bacterium]|jgi:hypothetical protein